MKKTTNTLFSLLLISICILTGNDIYSANVVTNEIGSAEKDGYILIWQDLFNNSTLDTLHWNIEVNGNGGGNNELQYYKEANVAIENESCTGKSCLVISARKEQYQDKLATSGRINTHGKIDFKYGKIEASIKLPQTRNGLWPAFWILGSDYQSNIWPACGEIDILEMGHIDGIKSETQDRYFNGACHWGSNWEPQNYSSHATMVTADYSLQDDFHLYTLIWDESSIKAYLDMDKFPNNNPYFEMPIKEGLMKGNVEKYFHTDFFIILNLAVGGDFTNIWNIDHVTALKNGESKMYVDYVKLYQKTHDK